jgi:hypothetical protein
VAYLPEGGHKVVDVGADRFNTGDDLSRLPHPARLGGRWGRDVGTRWYE